MDNFGLLSYSNEKNINVIPKEAFEKALSSTFQTISENISKSLGPLGSSATILDGLRPEATKDGFAILKNYRFTNRYKRMFFNLIKTPCERLNNSVGDGTTTSIVLTNYLFQIYENKKKYLSTLYRLPKTFVSIWDSLVAEIIERVESFAKPISNDDIFHIAYISSNGNKEVSETIAEIYRECSSPVIREKDSPTNKTYVKAIHGYELPMNLVSDAYIRNEDLSVDEEDFVVLIFDYKIETDFCSKVIFPAAEVFRAMGKKLLVMAPAYDKYLVETRLQNYQSSEFQRFRQFSLLIGQWDGGKAKKHQIEDFAVLVNGTLIDQEKEKVILKEFSRIDNVDRFVHDCLDEKIPELENLFGKVEKATMSCVSGSTFIPFDVEKNSRYQELLRSVKKDLEEEKSVTIAEETAYSVDLYEIQSRINRLEMRNYIYYIGADSTLQKKILWDQVEDVIKCVSSSVQHGCLPGCQLSIIKAASEISHEILSNAEDFEKLCSFDKLKLMILSIIIDAVIATYVTVLDGPEHTGILKMIDNWYSYKAEDLEKVQELIKEKRDWIVKESINRNCVFDLESLEFNPNIITSAETDKLVLLAASELVKILISGTQCIYLDADVNNSEVQDLGKM